MNTKTLLTCILLAAGIALTAGCTAETRPTPVPAAHEGPETGTNPPQPSAIAETQTPMSLGELPQAANDAPSKEPRAGSTEEPEADQETREATPGESALGESTPGESAEPTAPMPEPTPHMAREPSDQPGRPGNPEGTLEAIRGLTQEERDCLPGAVREGRIELSPNVVVGQSHARTLRAVADCISDEAIMRLMVIPSLEEKAGLLSPEEKECLGASNTGRTIRSALLTDGEYPRFSDAMTAAAFGLVINARTCLGNRFLKAVGLERNDVEQIVCIIRDAPEAERLTNAIVNGDDAILEDLEEQARDCGLQSDPDAPAEPPE